jgi:predicted MFS family arabinose efflux permease
VRFLTQERRIYAFGFFHMFLVLIPVIIPFYQSFGLSMSQIFQLQAIFGVAVVVFEVPTGYIADLFGRKASLLFGLSISALGFLGYALGSQYWHFALIQALLGLGLSFVSGSDEALLYESLPREDRKRTANAFANMQLSEQCGESIASLLGGFLATLSLAYAAWGQFVAALLGIVVALGIKETKRAKPSRAHKENFRRVYREIFFSDPILRLTFVNSVVWGLSTFIAVWTYQKHWQEVGVPLALFGVIWAGYNITTGVIGKSVHALERRWGARKLLLFMALLPTLGYFGMALVPGFLSIAFGLCHYVSRGINGVVMSDAMNWRLSSDFRATAGSLKSFAFRLGFALVGPLVGLSIDHLSLDRTYLILGLIFLLLIPLSLLPLIRRIEATGRSEVPHTTG